MSDATITSTSQPLGVKKLSGMTNETGYITFRNVLAGNYTFTITKDGYETINQTINFKGTTLSTALTMAGGNSGVNIWLIITVVVIVVVVIAVISLVFINRRRASKYPDELDISKFLSS